VMEPLGVGLIGLGTIGSGVARLLSERADWLAHRARRRLDLVRVAVRDLDRPRSVDLAGIGLTTDGAAIIDDPRISVVVELIGGIEPARSLILRALTNGKDVVTANKALLAEHGQELFATARLHRRALAFEGAVGGGIPIVQALTVGLAANHVESLAAIVNGTCNFILTAMTKEGWAYQDALKQAQALGYAEADPTLDVDGTDTVHKLAILAQLAFGANVRTNEIPREGIDRLDLADLRFAGELGYSVKLLALARLVEGDLLDLRVAPSLVRRGTPLAEVAGPYNAIRVVGDAVGDTLFYGRGAGTMPTASAVVSDLIDVAIGRARLSAEASDLWSAQSAPARLAGPDRVRRRYYLRLSASDRPGVIGAIARLLGDHQISIASVIQHDPGEENPPGGPVPLVMMTHLASEANVVAALDEIDQLDVVRPPSVRIGVEE
jgi:homoserine dehydrogenase